MILDCENPTDLEIIVGTYEEFVLGYRVLKTESGRFDLSQSFANHSHRASVRCVANGGKFVASGGADETVQIYDMKMRKESGVLMHHDRTVTCLAFVNQTHLASASEDGDIALFRAGSWELEKVLAAHREAGVTAFAVHPSGKLAISCGKDNTLRTWNLVKGRPAYTTNLHAQGEVLAWSPSGDHYAVIKFVNGGSEFAVDVYSISVAGIVYTVVPKERPATLSFLQNDVLAVGSDSGNVELHTPLLKNALHSFRAHKGRVKCIECVQFKSGEKWMVTAASDGNICIWKYKDWSTEKSTKKITPPEKIGEISSGCRVTCMVLISAPVQISKKALKAAEEVENKEEIGEKPSTSSRNVGRVTIEIEESDKEGEGSSKSKKKKKKKRVIVDRRIKVDDSSEESDTPPPNKKTKKEESIQEDSSDEIDDESEDKYPSEESEGECQLEDFLFEGSEEDDPSEESEEDQPTILPSSIAKKLNKKGKYGKKQKEEESEEDEPAILFSNNVKELKPSTKIKNKNKYGKKQKEEEELGEGQSTIPPSTNAKKLKYKSKFNKKQEEKESKNCQPTIPISNYKKKINNKGNYGKKKQRNK